MTNENNLINLVNKNKPIELVQELKDYEIKTSKLSPAARSKVIKKWGSNYVSENKEGYGPCYERCGWNNPYCSYQEWMDLYISCPAAGCTNTSIANWTHKVDGGVLEVSDHTNIRCKNCGTATHVSKWPFLACSNHNGVYKQASHDSFTKALSMAFAKQQNDKKELMKKILNFLFEDEW